MSRRLPQVCLVYCKVSCCQCSLADPHVSIIYHHLFDDTSEILAKISTKSRKTSKKNSNGKTNATSCPFSSNYQLWPSPNWWKYENGSSSVNYIGKNAGILQRFYHVLPIIGSLAATHQRLTSLSSNQNFIGHSPIDSTRTGHVQCCHRCLYLRDHVHDSRWWLHEWEQFNLQLQVKQLKRWISRLAFEDGGPSLHHIITLSH